MSGERTPLTFALLLSLLIHALLLSLIFGGQGWGLPGLGFPWQERRAEALELRVVLMPVRDRAVAPAVPAEEPSPPASIEQPHVGAAPTPSVSVSSASTSDQTAEAILPETEIMALAHPTTEIKPEAELTSQSNTAADAAPATAAWPADVSVDAAPAPIPEPEVVAVVRPIEWVVAPSAASAPTPVMAAAPSASSPEAVPPAPEPAIDAASAAERAAADRLEQEVQRQAALLEAAKRETERKEAALRQAEQVEAQRLETERQEAARQAVARQEAARQQAQQAENVRLEAERQQLARQEVTRQEAARQQTQQVEMARQDAERQQLARQEAARQEAVRHQAERIEAERLETERQEVARQEEARQEAARQEAQRVESARVEAERQQIARQDAARQQAERQETAARQAAARQEAARAEAAQDEARREASRRAMGRQLDEVAARREAASAAADLAPRLNPSSSGARRGRLFGRTDPNAELILYAEAWARKVELNMTVDRIRDAAQRPHANPLVTVAIRSDGSVESVTFVLSSGVSEIDDAIRRIVESLLPYPAFSPGLAREYDVIEIRRTWVIDSAVRLY